MKKEKTILYRLTQSYFILVILLLLITGTLILPTQLKEFNTALDEDISWTGYLISKNSQVTEEVKAGVISSELQTKLTDIIDHSADIDYIVLADINSIRLYHRDASLIGKKFIGGDQAAILSDPDPYITTSQGSQDMQKRSFQQITDSDGTVLGFILVSASLSTVRNAQYRLIAKFIFIFAILLALGMLFAMITARRIRNSLLGYEPDTFTQMFLQREEILDNLDEGIAAFDVNAMQKYMNPSARKLMADWELQKDSNTFSLVNSCIEKNQTYVGLPFEWNGNSLLLSLMPIFEKNRAVGVLAMFRDRTETIQLAEQLTGANHIVDALRANTHEYLNKLHIISGMLQMENYEQAIAFIDGISKETKDSYQTVIKQIQNKTIAALLLGKQSHAKELDIDFTLQKESFLPYHHASLSTQELVTIIGNLIENAFHAVEHNVQLKQVQIFISQTAEGLTIIADDNGCGMTEDMIDHIYRGNFTTRGEGHGIGLRLIQEIVVKHSGYLTIESEPNNGSIFTISIPQDKETSHD